MRGAAGWAPHADDYRRHQNRLTLWIPLTDATSDNGWMYVVPKDFIYGNRAPAKESLRAASIANDYCLELLQCCRALPAVADRSWAGIPNHPLGLEVPRADSTTYQHRMRVCGQGCGASAPQRKELLPGQAEGMLPTFTQRIRHIALSIGIHHCRELKTGKFAELAEKLIKRRNSLSPESRLNDVYNSRATAVT